MQVDTTVLSVLSRSTITGSALVLPEHLDRTMYVKANTVLEAAGGKWNRKAKAHLFNGCATAATEQILLTGQVTIPQDFGYYPTPPAVVERLVELADVQSFSVMRKPRLLEPSAGRGNIALAFADVAKVDCVELLPDNVACLEFCKAEGELHSIKHGDFLAIPQVPIYDRVVMNPPFEKQADILHINHALGFLKPGGLLVSVMSAGVMYRENKLTTKFREMVYERGGVFEPVDDGAFKSSGTMVRTVIVKIPN